MLLTVVPLAIVLWLSSERAMDEPLADLATSRDRSGWDAQIDATIDNPPDETADRPRPPATTASAPVRSSSPAGSHDAAVKDVKLAVAGVDSRSATAVAQVAVPASEPQSVVTPRVAQPETRVAMRADRMHQRDAASSFSSVEEELDVLALVPEPPRRPTPAGPVIAAGTVADPEIAKAQQLAQAKQQLMEQQAQQLEMERLNREMQQALTAPSPRPNQTWYDATGHLAMRTPSVKAPNAADGDDEEKDSRKPANRKSRVNGKTDPDTSRRDPPSAEANELATWLDPDNQEAAVPEIVEDVILQQPLESRNVSQVENVVAVTRAKGWPVAMVRSDIPDDDWWVQQMVGIRGNAFAARVNFGNEHSIPGSVYHMVIMFLDSPDEVRRFRIAKQFEKLPEGVRRSREFTFVRQ